MLYFGILFLITNELVWISAFCFFYKPSKNFCASYITSVCFNNVRSILPHLASGVCLILSASLPLSLSLSQMILNSRAEVDCLKGRNSQNRRGGEKPQLQLFRTEQSEGYISLTLFLCLSLLKTEPH